MKTGDVHDQHWMKRALLLAERGRGRTSPNPMVGAVLVKRGQVVGEGFHARAGDAHAEIVALREAGKEARGATLYTNLEPCTHYGKTPPCTPAVIESGVKRVVVGMKDPNPRVLGKGIKRLKASGIDVTVGVLEGECRRLNEAFSKFILKRTPFVILKVASTLDGKIAARDGNSKWISGEASRRFVHRLRGHVDGVLAGVGTVLRDDPLLTSRIRGGKDPLRIVLDSRLRISETAKVLQMSPSGTVVVTTGAAPRNKIEGLRSRGVRVLIVPSKRGMVDLRGCLSKLGEMGVMTLLVEGGSEINGAFLDQRLIDKFFLFLAPKWMGDPRALGIFGGRGAANLDEAIPISEIRIRKMGQDILLEGYMKTLG